MCVLRFVTFILLITYASSMAEPSVAPHTVLGGQEGTLEDWNGAVLADPKDDAALASRAAVHFRRGEFDEALNDANDAIWMNAKNGLAYAVVAEIANRKGYVESAFLYMDSALCADVARGDIDDGFRVANSALEMNPDDGFAYAILAFIADKNGDQEGAAAKYQRAVEVAPRLVWAYTGRALFRESKGDTKGALEDYTKAIEIDPKNVVTIYSRGRLRERSGDREGAFADFTEAIERDPTFADAYGSRGVIRWKKGDVDGALSDYNEAIDLQPASYLFFNRAIIEKDRGDIAAALADYSKAIELDPANLEAYRNRGDLREKMCYGLMAAADYSKVIALSPANQLPKFDPVKEKPVLETPALSELESDIKAVEQTTVTHDLGDNWQAYMSRGRASQKAGDLTGALADFTKAVALNGDNWQSYISRGAARWTAGDLAGAAADFNKAVELNEDDARGYENRGHARQAMGDTHGALADYRRFCGMSETGQDYPRLYIWVIRRRLGETVAANAELAAWIGQNSKVAPSAWVSKVAAYLLGQASEKDLFLASKSSDARTEHGQTCEAWYYVAVKKLLKGDKSGGTAALRRCLATEQKDYYEYQFARAELKKLAP